MLSSACLTLALLVPLQEGGSSTEELLRQIRKQGNQVPNAVFEELAQHQTPEALEALIKGLDGLTRAQKICNGYHALRHFAGVPEAAEPAAAYLARRARDAKHILALNATYRLGALGPEARPHLVELVLDPEAPDTQATALMHLVDQGMPLDKRQLKSFLRSKQDEVRYEALLVTTAAEADPGQRGRTLVKLAGARDTMKRLAAVELLGAEAGASLPTPRRFELLAEALADEDSRVARKALAALESTRQKAALPLLLGRLEAAGPEQRFRIAGSLQRLTGKDLGTEPGRWRRWWEAEGATFELPAQDAPAPAPTSPSHTSSSFYGLPLYAENLVFAVDSSKSMGRPAQGESGPSRMAVAKEQLTQAIAGLPESARFDIVDFGAGARAWKGELTDADKSGKAAASKHVQYMDMTLGTEIYAALREAFRDPRTDTILLLTDGDPQLSVMQDRAGMRRIVTQWNRTRHVAIDCLSIGTARDWLRKLAQESGGRYRTLD